MTLSAPGTAHQHKVAEMESTIEKCHCGEVYDEETFIYCPYCYARQAHRPPAFFSFGKTALTQKALKALIDDLQKTYDERSTPEWEEKIRERNRELREYLKERAREKQVQIEQKKAEAKRRRERDYRETPTR